METDKHQLIGRGSSDDKGPIIGWLNSIEAHQKAGIEFPVNLKICFEGFSRSLKSLSYYYVIMESI